MEYKIYHLPADHHAVHSPSRNENGEDLIKAYFGKLLQKECSYLTSNGREAISQLLRHLKLQLQDEVFITTSFGFQNVSSCVTSTVFNYRKPSRVLSENTKAIFVIHEFGTIHPEIDALISEARKRQIPLIEDCAHSFLSRNNDGKNIGSFGDWTILSFSKFYPVHSGGMVLGKKAINELSGRVISVRDSGIIVHSIDQNTELSSRRIAILDKLHNEIKNDHFKPLLKDLNSYIVPWFFPIEVPDPEKTSSKLRSAGIETGRWHGTNILVLPLHQYINDAQLGYMIQQLNHFAHE